MTKRLEIVKKLIKRTKDLNIENQVEGKAVGKKLMYFQAITSELVNTYCDHTS